MFWCTKALTISDAICNVFLLLINSIFVSLIKFTRVICFWKYLISDSETVKNGSGLVELIILLFLLY